MTPKNTITQRKQYPNELLKDKEVQRWYDNVKRGAQVTADVYLRRLRAFCKQVEKTPLDLVEMEERALFNLLLDFVGTEEKKGYAGSYIESTIKTVKSWLGHNRRVITQKIRIKDLNARHTLKNERVPTQEELKKIFLSATGKDRVSCVLMAHSGVRPEVLGNYLGTDGLTVEDFPEMRIEGDNVIWDKIPTMVTIRKELSKTRKQYFTFLSGEGCEYLKNYLEERIRSGEELKLDTDIITPQKSKKKFIQTLNIGVGIRKAIRRAGFYLRPYVLRSYFDTQLLLSESRGKITHAYRQFFMGHKGDMEGRYTIEKARLPEEIIEDMREAYSRSQSFLQTTGGTEADIDTLKRTVRKQFLIMLGMSEEEIEGLDLEDMTDTDITDFVKDKLSGELSENGKRQKVIPAGNMEKCINEGWEYVATLPGDKFIIRLPF